MKEEVACNGKIFLLLDLNAPKLPKMYQVSRIFYHIIFTFLWGDINISWGASTILLGGPLGISSWQARAQIYPHDLWGSRRGALHLKMLDLGLQGGPAPHIAPNLTF